jgi:hypothetical protein
MVRHASDTLPADMTDRPVLALLHGDVLRLRRRHPCGGTDWLVDRLGADIGLTCLTCGRHVLIARRQLERRLSSFVRRGSEAAPEPTGPGGHDGPGA